MSTSRARRALLAITLVMLGWVGIAPMHARAQTQTDVALILLSETAWSSPTEPELRLAFRAQNGGAAPIEDLTIGVTIGAAIRSRSAYEDSLTEGPGLPIFATTIAEPGTLEAGRPRRFSVVIDLSTIGGLSPTDSLVYPMRIDLRSAGTPVAALDTPMVFVVRKPEVPLLLSATIELTGPMAFDPQGRLADRSLEAAVAPRGSLAAEVRGLKRLATSGAAVQLAVEPALLDQLQRMSDGFQRSDGSTVASGVGAAADAAALITTLRRVAASSGVNVSVMPFAAPNIPSLLASGLATDLASQEALGRDVVTSVLGVEPDAMVTRPPGGALSDPAVQSLAALGTTTILANADTVARPPQPNGFAPPPTGSLAVGGQVVALVLPDPGTQNLLASAGFLDDPVRAAQALIGELVTIWREQPIPSQPRGVAILLPSGLPPRFWGAFLDRIATAPFLEPVAAGDLVREIPPPAAPSELAARASDRFTPTYVDAIKRERRDLLALRSMLVGPSGAPDQLGADLLRAESAIYLENEDAGRAWIDQVSRATGEVFARSVPDVSQEFTFLQETGSIPLLMGDPGDLPIRFIVQLRSNRFLFPSGDRQTVTLTQPNQVVTFRVTAKAAGQSPIQVIVRAPTGRPIRQATLVVRSRAVNRIAAAVTVAAALALVALWARRLVRRRTS